MTPIDFYHNLIRFIVVLVSSFHSDLSSLVFLDMTLAPLYNLLLWNSSHSALQIWACTAFSIGISVLTTLRLWFCTFCIKGGNKPVMNSFAYRCFGICSYYLWECFSIQDSISHMGFWSIILLLKFSSFFFFSLPRWPLWPDTQHIMILFDKPIASTTGQICNSRLI